MASWAAVPALSGFSWDGRSQAMAFGGAEGTNFWSNGRAWGTCRVGPGGRTAELKVLGGGLSLKSFRLGDRPAKTFKTARALQAGESISFEF